MVILNGYFTNFKKNERDKCIKTKINTLNRTKMLLSLVGLFFPNIKSLNYLWEDFIEIVNIAFNISLAISTY